MARQPEVPNFIISVFLKINTREVEKQHGKRIVQFDRAQNLFYKKVR